MSNNNALPEVPTPRLKLSPLQEIIYHRRVGAIIKFIFFSEDELFSNIREDENKAEKMLFRIIWNKVHKFIVLNEGFLRSSEKAFLGALVRKISQNQVVALRVALK